ncbi:25S rRNA (cytosine-C(5))-methyltransferase nop2 (Nucleolar protein 2) [Durusdinium trenchii]|uniref:25S rRNA (Cytosine-C(5))-methyltransferase nop2 (Nucleolar protein 2) n=1 Tax=Durusdinium trenchii TaxID=1381693 RepID=A0ABP0KCA6_9DINO
MKVDARRKAAGKGPKKGKKTPPGDRVKVASTRGKAKSGKGARKRSLEEQRAPDAEQEEQEELLLQRPRKPASKKAKTEAKMKRSKALPVLDEDEESSDSEGSEDQRMQVDSEDVEESSSTSGSECSNEEDDEPQEVAPLQKRKPKQMFVDDDDEKDDDDDDDSSASDEDSDPDGLAGFKNKGMDSESESDGAAESDEGELDGDVADVMEVFELPQDGDELEEDVDPATVEKRIKEILGVLSNWRKMAPKGQSRSDFVDQLTKDCARLYGYLPSLIEQFLKIFSPDEMVEFLQANETPRPVVIRTNTLKARRRDLAKILTSRGVNLEPLADWSNVGLKVFESTVPIGATPEYLAGHYMLQSASSFAPVLALDPQVNERVLDMSSAPGGKTTYVAQLMKNTGLVVANDPNKDRINATVSNCARLGIRNTIHCCHDGRQFPKVMGGFDRVLLDAPCSGLGVIQRDPSVKLSRTIDNIRTTAKLQKQLLLSAIDSVDHKSKKGGIVVYSTCSISPEENEMVVQYAMEKRDVRILDTGLPFGRPGLARFAEHRFHPSMKHARRLYPHVHNMDGFFLVKLQKVSRDGEPGFIAPPKNLDAKKKSKQEKQVESGKEEKKKKDGNKAAKVAAKIEVKDNNSKDKLKKNKLKKKKTKKAKNGVK